ncbi:MAG: S9 family peptidase [Gemmatimonadetes bacterium]|nr:MAG: S9 family peptidase [Gemmatimonadota bacterium]
MPLAPCPLARAAPSAFGRHPGARTGRGSPATAAFAAALAITLAGPVFGGVLPGASAPALAAQQAASSPRPLAIDDLFRLRRVGAPVVSPDGAWIAYTVTTTDLEAERSRTRLWMVPTEGGEPLPMTAEGSDVSSPAWSPDGRYLSFLSARGEGAKTQVWVLDRRGGEAWPMTDVPQGVSAYAWSPDGSRLLLTLRDPEPERPPRGKNAPPEPWVIDRLQFKRDGVGYLTGERHTHLYVFDVATRSLRQITSGRWDESQAVWSPDGTRVAFVSNRTEEPDGNSNTDIWIVAADNTDRGATLQQVTTNPGADNAPAWSPDGRRIAYVTVLEPDLIWYATRHLAVVDVEGESEHPEPRVLTRSLDRNVRAPRFSDEGKGLWFLLEDSAEDHLAWIGLDGGGLERPVSGPLSVNAYDLGPGGVLATRVATLTRPHEIFVGWGEKRRRLTHENDALLSELSLGRVENVHFRSADGTEIEGFVTFPPGFQEGLRYPTLLRIHGGPVSQYRHAFNFEAQLFAANGYVVVQTNPRGSSGYGQAFSAALWADWGGPDYEDVMAGVDYAIERGWADPERLGVGGWSYGGILTDHVITRTDRFRAAITGASEVLYVANYGHDHYQLQWEKELGLPWEGDNREKWERISPFNRVQHITTPTLIMGGEKDWNVPILNGEQLYQALRRRGVPTQLVVYPGQGHGLRPPSYQRDRYERYLAWYDRWVKPQGGPTGSGEPREGGR